jgi:hypothetical protein
MIKGITNQQAIDELLAFAAKARRLCSLMVAADIGRRGL